MDGNIGMIKLFVSETSPEGWAACNGQLLSSADFSALHAKIGTKFGEDGEGTFRVPQLPKHEAGWFHIRVAPMAEGTEAPKGMLSQIVLYAGEDDLEGWVDCQGQVLNMSDYPVLGKVMGSQYGGDGVSNFALPNIPVVAGVRYLICLDGVNPMGENAGSEEEDDDDY